MACPADPECGVRVRMFLASQTAGGRVAPLLGAATASAARRVGSAGTDERLTAVKGAAGAGASPRASAGATPEPKGAESEELAWEDVEWDGAALAERAAKRLAKQDVGVNEFWRRKYDGEAARNWDKFYTRNEDRFFKDRHYIDTDFPELRAAAERPTTMVEFGCGVGNAVLPLLERLPHLRASVFDLSARGIEILRAHEVYRTTGRCDAFVLDATTDDLPPRVRELTGPAGADVCLCLFMLSAVAPEKHHGVFDKMSAALRPGGTLLFRDYGRYDEAQLRFATWNRISDNFYVRSDGTQSYFFSTEDAQQLASRAGLQVAECRYLCRRYRNRKLGKVMHRVWLHARFKKPLV